MLLGRRVGKLTVTHLARNIVVSDKYFIKVGLKNGCFLA